MACALSRPLSENPFSKRDTAAYPAFAMHHDVGGRPLFMRQTTDGKEIIGET
jgi:hypothetical protein